MERRLFLAALGAGSAATLAGCSSGASTTTGDTDVSVPAADVAGRNLSTEGWRKVADSEEQVLDREVAFVNVEGYSHTTQYEDRALRRKLREGTMGNFDATVMQFFTSRVELDPAFDELPFGVGLDTIMTEVKGSAESQLKTQMKQQGLENIREGRTGNINIRGGPKAWMKSYSADFRYPSMEFSVSDDQTLEIPAGSLSVWGALSAWKGKDSILVAGGACPGEEFTESFTKEVTDLITVSVNIDLELRPEQQKREIRNLIRNVR